MAATRLFLWIVLIGCAVASASSMREVHISDAMKDEFNFLDKDGNGVLTAEELLPKTEKMELKLSKEELQERIAAVDEDDNDTVEVGEFVNLLFTLVHFKLYDKNGDGFITLEELKQGLPPTARHWPDVNIKAMLEKHDLDKNGQLNFAEFVNLWKDKLRVEEEKSANQKEEVGKSSKSSMREMHIISDAMRGEFNSLDKDGNGALTAEELLPMTKAMGLKLSKEELEEQIAAVDKDNSDTVDREEFVELAGVFNTLIQFMRFDQNKDGFLSFEELKKWTAITMKKPMSDSEIQDLISHYDSDGDKQLNRKEFVNLWNDTLRAEEEKSANQKGEVGKSSDSIIREVHISEEIRGAFQSLDSDGTASITPEELDKLMEKWGLKLSDAELKRIIAKADTDRNNAVELEEFVDLISEIANIMFTHLDQNGDGFLTCEELKKWTVVKPMSDTQIQELISRYDSDGDKQKLNQEEFVKLMTAMLQKVDENSA